MCAVSRWKEYFQNLEYDLPKIIDQYTLSGREKSIYLLAALQYYNPKIYNTLQKLVILL
jgi:hypothetical protein